MATARRLICITFAALGLTLPAHAQTGRDLAAVLADVDQGFVCPQFRADDSARRADMIAFSRAMASVGSHRISYRRAAYIHAKMLERHNCSQHSTTEAGVAPVMGEQPETAAATGTLPPD